MALKGRRSPYGNACAHTASGEKDEVIQQIVPVAYTDLTQQICNCVKRAWMPALSFPAFCLSFSEYQSLVNWIPSDAGKKT